MKATVVDGAVSEGSGIAVGDVELLRAGYASDGRTDRGTDDGFNGVHHGPFERP